MKKAKLLLSLSSVAMLAGLTGCGVKGAEYKPGTAVKVGLICLHDSNSTYDANFINALNEAVKNLGATKVVLDQSCVLTGVNEDEACYDAAKDLVKKGCNLIFADSFGHQSFMLQAAKEWPSVQFCHATGTNAKTANQANYHNAFASIYEGRYLAGYAAGLRLYVDNIDEIDTSSWTGTKVGYVGAYPYAEVKSGYTSWFLGLREAFHDIHSRSNGLIPDYANLVQMDVKFTNSWYDVTAEGSAATALIESGCTLISQHADSMGAPNACKNKNIPNVTYNIETKTECPDTYLAYSRINWAPYYENVVNSMFAGKSIEGEKNANWTGTIATGSVEYNVNWDNVVRTLDESLRSDAKAFLQDMFNNKKTSLTAGTTKVFDTAKFTLAAATATKAGATIDANGHVTSYKADTDGDFVGDTEAIVTGTGSAPSFFNESYYCSAPYFDLDIEGINLPAQN